VPRISRSVGVWSLPVLFSPAAVRVLFSPSLPQAVTTSIPLLMSPSGPVVSLLDSVVIVYGVHGTCTGRNCVWCPWNLRNLPEPARLINESDHEVAVNVTIDGLNLFALRDDKNDKSQYVVVSAHSASDVLGWYRNDKLSSVFQVADLPEHPDAKLLKNPALIGAFTLTFAASWERDSQKPKDEPATNQATEIVPGADIDAGYVPVKRFIGAVRASVTVRYDKM
jgi:hypothetical protein